MEVLWNTKETAPTLHYIRVLTVCTQAGAVAGHDVEFMTTTKK